MTSARRPIRSSETDLGAAQYDVFCTANFLNFAPWRASIEMLLDHGIDRVAAHNQALIERLINGLENTEWRLVNPREEPARSTLLLVRHRDDEQLATAVQALADAAVDVAERALAACGSRRTSSTPLPTSTARWRS